MDFDDEKYDDIDSEEYDDSEDEEEDSHEPKPPVVSINLSDRIKEGLLYSQEDIDSSRQVVLFCPYEVEDDSIVVHADGNDPGSYLCIEL